MIKIFDGVDFSDDGNAVILGGEEDHLNSLVDGVDQTKILVHENEFVIFVLGKIHEVIDQILHHLLGECLFFQHDDSRNLVVTDTVRLSLADLFLDFVVMRELSEVARDAEVGFCKLLVLFEYGIDEL